MIASKAPHWRLTPLALVSAVTLLQLAEQEGPASRSQRSAYVVERDAGSAAVAGGMARPAHGPDLELRPTPLNTGVSGARLAVAVPPADPRANSAFDSGWAVTAITDPDLLQTANLTIDESEAEGALALAEQLRWAKPVPYADRLATRIEEIVDDWSDDTSAPSIASLGGLLTFVMGHPSWTRPRVYADAAGRFSAEWSAVSGHHLMLRFLDASTAEFLYRPGSRPHPRWGRVPLLELDDQLTVLRVDRWISRANG